MLKQIIASSLVSLGLGLGVISSRVVAQMPHEIPPKIEQTSSFRAIEQPLWIKAAVTIGGLGLIGLELWWFLLSQPKSQIKNR